MAEIKVDCYLRHCTEVGVKRSDQEWRAAKGVQIIKGQGINGSFNFQINGTTTSVSNGNSVVFTEEICQRVGQRLKTLYGAGITLVPIPNSEALGYGVQKDFRTYQLARRSAAIAACDVSDLLRWNSPVGKTHKGERSRDADAHSKLLKVMRVATTPVVLFDDVVTSGSQMYGAQLALEGAGMKVAGMVAIAEVLAKGERGDVPGWRTATRNPFSIQDVMDSFSF